MKKIILILAFVATNSFADKIAISHGTESNQDTSDSAALSIFVNTSPDGGIGVAKGALIRVERTEGTARNIDALRAEIYPKGEKIDSSNGVHGVVYTKNGTPKPGAAFTGLWGESYAPKNTTENIPYIAVGAEVNVYQTKPRNALNNYLIDPLLTKSSTTGGTIGVLINNYQGAAENGHLAYDPNHIGIGNYWNDFGLAITSQSKSGRALGYQTGIYVSEVAKELIHLRGGVLGNNDIQTEYGILFDGTPMSKAAIAIGRNKINFGGYSGILANEGDMFYNSSNGQLWFKDKISNKVLLKTDSIGVENSILTTVNGNSRWSDSISVNEVSIKNKKETIEYKNGSLSIDSNAGLIKLNKTTYVKNKYSCKLIHNSLVNRDDVIILNLRNNKQEGIFTMQVDNINDGQFRVCVKSDIDIEVALNINFAKINVQ